MPEMKKIPERNEIPQKDRWAVEDLYPSDEAWMQDLEKMKALTAELASFAGRLGESAADLFEYASKLERAGVLLSNLFTNALLFDTLHNLGLQRVEWFQLLTSLHQNHMPASG